MTRRPDKDIFPATASKPGLIDISIQSSRKTLSTLLKYRRSRLQQFLLMLILFIAVALIGPIVWPADATTVNLEIRLQSPSLNHPFGTDQFGRDVFERFMEGARLSILFGLVSIIVGAVVGTFIGALAGLAGGIVDSIIMRCLDAVLAFPALILAMAIAIAAGPGAWTAGIAVAVVATPWYARRVRSEVLSLRSRPYIEAERVMGAKLNRILFSHMLPAVLGGVAAQASLGVGYAILTITGLGFLGLGVQPPTPEWGSMITEGKQYLLSGQWWISIFPGLGIIILVALTTAIGNAIGDRLGIRE